MSTHLRFYNPREAPPEVLEAMLVGREDILNELLSDLTRQATSASRQHWLLRGPRGIGKTHLVGIIYHRLRSSPELSQRYLPIWLAETEAYSAYSAAVLLLQIAERLVEELRLAGDHGAGDLEKKLGSLEPAGDDPALFEEVCEILKAEAARRKKILLVLMENLDALLTSYSGQRGAKEVRRLRALLSEDKELLFLSTTPTRFLALSDPKQPLYGHLKERTIRPLDEDQLGLLLEQLARLTGRSEILKPEGAEDEFRLRRRVLHRLTGGNPRAIVMAVSVLSGTPGIQAIVQEMSALLDAQTAYFEARLAQLAPRERTIVTAMALAPENLTVAEIAARTRLSPRSLSTQIDRLIAQGFLSPASGEGGKGTIYEVSDGLFRLWYQYRKGRKILQPIVRFLAFLHPEQDLEKAFLELQAALSGDLNLLDRDLLSRTSVQIEEALRFLRSEEGLLAREQLWASCSTPPEKGARALPAEITAAFDRARQSSHESDIQEAIQKVNSYLNSSEPSPFQRIEAQWMLGAIFLLLGRHEKSASMFTSLAEQAKQWPEGLRPFWLSMTLVAEALSLSQLEKAHDSLAVWLRGFDLLSQVQPSERASLQTVYLGILPKILTMNESSEGLATAEALLPRLTSLQSPADTPVISQALLRIGLLFLNFDRAQEAAECYLAVVKRNAENPTEEARSLWRKAMLCLALTWSGFLSNSDESTKWRLTWSDALLAAGDASFEEAKPILFVFLAHGDNETAGELLEFLQESQSPTLRENATLYRSALDVLKAVNASPKAKGGHAVRLRSALARVPPELRQAIEELTTEILARQRQAKSAKRHR